MSTFDVYFIFSHCGCYYDDIMMDIKYEFVQIPLLGQSVAFSTDYGIDIHILFS